MNAVQFLKQEHEKAKTEFEKVLKASPATRGDLWKQLAPGLEVHEQIEDACLYEPMEEGTIFPRLAGVWDMARLERAGRELEEMKASKVSARR